MKHLLIFDYRFVGSTRSLYSVVLRKSVNIWNLQRWWVSSMIVLEAMTIHFEVATIWVNQLGGSVWEEEEADELYRDVDINQGRGLQVYQDIEDSHVTLTLTHSDGQQESSSTSSFVTNLLNSIIDPADLSEMELKKILIDKMEGNKSIQRSDEQRNLYKALVEAYDADKTILDSYEESAILKRRREDDDDQEGPSARSDRGPKRRREGGEHASASTPSEPATETAGKSTTGS
nr:hypothetical protein [Tanacetum cinerariifolium]